MAEFDDIEYEGVGADRSVRSVGNERCFRDRSPCDTVISLSDDGKGLYYYHTPLFHEPSEQPQHPQELYRPVNFGGASTPVLSYEAITAIMGSRPSSPDSRATPLGRYRRDVQAHEQLALGETPHHPRKRLSGADEEPKSSSHAECWRSTTPEGPPPILHDLQARRTTTSAAAELSDLIELKNSPAWNDMPVDEQMQLVRTINALRPHAKAQDVRRQSSAIRKRKRDRTHARKD